MDLGLKGKEGTMVTLETIETLYSQGTAEHREDGFFVNPPFFGVVDGFSSPYHYKMKQIRFGGFSGGEMVRQVILKTFYNAKPDFSLKEIILRANQGIGAIQTTRGIPIDHADRLAGASFVFTKVKTETIEIIQGGDCLAVWLYASGEIGATKNQAYQHVSKNLVIIAELMDKHNHDRKEMWIEFYPILSRQRQQDINQKTEAGYAILSGQPSLEECWLKVEIPVERLKLLLLFTDGFVPYSETAEEMKMAKRLITDYEKWGLDGILKRKRQKDKREEEKSYIAQDEATAIALNFNPELQS